MPKSGLEGKDHLRSFLGAHFQIDNQLQSIDNIEVVITVFAPPNTIILD